MDKNEILENMKDAGAFLVEAINSFEDNERKNLFFGHIGAIISLIKIYPEEKIQMLKEIIRKLEEKTTKMNYIL